MWFLGRAIRERDGDALRNDLPASTYKYRHASPFRQSSRQQVACSVRAYSDFVPEQAAHGHCITPRAVQNTACRFLCEVDHSRHSGGIKMVLTIDHITPIVALVAGILILIMPSLLSYVVAIYLIVVGLIGLNGIYHFVS
jgi:hypothetical protein